VSNDDAIMLHQYLANAPPLQVMLDLVGDESETAVVLLQSNALVEVGATFELAQPKSAQDPHVVAELRSTVRKTSGVRNRKLDSRSAYGG
jgi:hypothetical protein